MVIALFTLSPGMAMGWLLPKTLLKWREPKFARQTRHSLEEASTPRWLRPSIALLWAGLIMSKWLQAALNPQKNPPPLMVALTLAVVGSGLMVYVLPAIGRLGYSEIRITDVAILISDGGHTRRLDYSRIHGCRIASEETKEGISVLEITTSRSNTTIVGVDSAVSLDDLQRVLTERAVSVSRACLPSNESMEVVRS